VTSGLPVSLPTSSSDAWAIPELGPPLGRLVDPSGIPAERGALDIDFEDIRLDLVTGIFDVAGAARSFAAAGDRQSAVASLGRVAWLDLWERAVAAAAKRLAGAVNARLRDAAKESRLPSRRLATFLLTSEDVRAIAARLGSGGASFVSALDALEQTVPAAAASGPRGRTGQEDWQLALATTARRLEAAWLALTVAARTEQERWKREIDRVRAWRRPTWPLWLLTLVVLLGMTYLGLVLGGYLPVPAVLQGLAEFWWSHL
jgi:hypothetical protein